MPGFNSTGPMGAGPLTGGGRGLCNPARAEGLPPPSGGYAYGRGLRRGFRCGIGPGAGRGYGRGYRRYRPGTVPIYAVDNAGEIDMLKAQAENMQNSLATINNRIRDMETKPAAEA